MSQYAVSEIRLEVDDCAGLDDSCEFEGVVDAVLDPVNEVARWSCPACKTENETEIPTDDTRGDEL